MSSLPRDVLKWLQSLDLSHSAKNTRRDFSNGYLIAEIFSWYFPQDIQMHSFSNGTSIELKVGNWSILQRFFQRQGFSFPQQEIEGTIHCKPNAAFLLIQRIYCALTNRIIPTLSNMELSFSDWQYQEDLPLHARSTASQAVKNNIANSELHTDPDCILGQKKAQDIIKQHVHHRQEERKLEPKRFGIKPSLCERSLRRLPREGSGQREVGNLAKLKGGNNSEQEENDSVEESNQRCPEVKVYQSNVEYTERAQLVPKPIHLNTIY